MDNYQLTTNVPGRMHIGTNAKWTDHYVEAEEADDDELVNNYFERHAPQSTEHVEQPLVAPELFEMSKEDRVLVNNYFERHAPQSKGHVEEPLIAPEWLTVNDETDEGDEDYEDYEELSTNDGYVESPLIAPDMEF